ncbi:MAG: hypothetical protein ACRCZF_10405 [Gemmataceae bacterium]
MRRMFGLMMIGCGFFSFEARAEEPKRYAERTPTVKHPPAHTAERAGTVLPFHAHATPTLTSAYSTGYVGGGKLIHGSPRATAPVADGTFGWDYTGFGRRPGRIFLGFGGDRPRSSDFQKKYTTDTFKLPDPVAAQPFKKAVKEAREERAEERHGEHR